MTQDNGIPQIDILQSTEEFLGKLRDTVIEDTKEIEEIINGSYRGVALAEVLELGVELQDSIEHVRRQRREISILFKESIFMMDKALKFLRGREKEAEDELREATEDNRESTESDTT